MHDPHARNLRKGRWRETGITYSITTALLERHATLNADERRIVIDALQWLRQQQRARLYAFVVMPDHVHLVIQPIGGRLIDAVMRSWKDFSALRINEARGTRGGLWQRAFHDRAVRDEAEFFRCVEYVHQNPVRAGLAPTAEEFEASSAHPRWSAAIDQAW